MIKHDDGMIEYEVGDAVYDSDGDGGHVVGVNDDEGIVWIEPYCDKGSAYRWGLDAITPADPPAEQDGLYEIDEAIEDVEAGRTRTIDPDVGFVKETAEQPQRTVKQEWEYAMECAGIAAKHTDLFPSSEQSTNCDRDYLIHTTPDDLSGRVFVALARNEGWNRTTLPDLADHALKAAKAFRDAQQAQGGGE